MKHFLLAAIFALSMAGCGKDVEVKVGCCDCEKCVCVDGEKCKPDCPCDCKDCDCCCDEEGCPVE